MLIQSVTDYAIFMLDLGGFVISWNGGAERLKGYHADEIVGQHFSCFYPDEDRRLDRPQLALRTAARDGRFEAEGWRVRKDGSRFWANVFIYPVRQTNGDLIGFTKVTRDLTERKRAEEALQQSEERFRLLVEGVTDYAICMLDPQGNVTSWNAGAERCMGYSSEEIIGRHFSIFHTAEDNESNVPNGALQLATTHGQHQVDGWRVRKDGSSFLANVVVGPIRRSGGELLGYTTITRDLTERLEAQKALEQAQESLLQAQKMDAIGKLTGGIAHDFNNLLSAITGSLDLAERRLDAGQDVSQFLANARTAAERGAELTQRMLAFARKQQLRIEAVDVPETVGGMAELLSRTLGPGINISTSFPVTLPAVQADATQLELAVMNLAVNARDAMPSGGRITIAAECRSGGNAALPPADYVCLSVSDNGVGMNEETRSRATEPFFTTKGVGKGTGLGLSMVLGMVEQCGGRLLLHSEPQHGTTAELWLPVASEQPSRVAASDVDVQPALQPLCILAVDDDFIVLMNTALMLEDMGHEVLQAASGAAALDILAQRHVDLLVTDYCMPGTTGAELIAQARRIRTGLPVVLASGYIDLPEAQAIDAPRLSKPFSEAELARSIAMALRSSMH